MKLLILFLALIAQIAPFSHAAFTFNDDRMEEYLNQGGSDLAYEFAPVWYFTESQGYPSCYPTWAFGGKPNRHAGDTYNADNQSPGVDTCEYPDVTCGCREPGVPTKTRGPQFPIYYTYSRCSDNEVRVAYNTFYEKDGAWYYVIDIFAIRSDTGHPYDWENVIVSITRDDGGSWTATSLLLGGHGIWWQVPWDQLYTLDDGEIGDNAPNSQANKKHPKVYPSWSKHAHFPDTGPLPYFHWSLPYQSTCKAVRTADWWAFVDRQNFIRADLSTEAGQWINNVDWGAATSNPANVHERPLCSIVGEPQCNWKRIDDEFKA